MHAPHDLPGHRLPDSRRPALALPFALPLALPFGLGSRSARLWIGTLLLAFGSFALLLATSPLHAQEREAGPARNPQAPFFLVENADPAIDRLPLKNTEVDVQVSGVIAQVRVTQHYRNEGTRPLEARYVFPGSTQAAVGGLTVRMGDRSISARIREKQQARIDYEAARTEGRGAALLEQQLPNVFQMQVANIPPGQEVQVVLDYTELLVPQDGRYRFVFPTVVGPRYYSPGSSLRDAAWVSQPTLRAGVPPPSAFALRMSIDSPVALHALRSSTHSLLRTGAVDERHAQLSIDPAAGAANDRDFVLDWRLSGDRIQTGLMLHQGQGADDENFFLAMVQPPASVPATRILPRDYQFVVDISGSMHGFPLDTAKALLERLIGGLRPTDTFNVLLFSGSSRKLAPHSVPATPDNIRQALATLSGVQSGGGTELVPALRRVYAEPKPPDVARTVVVVTDGYVTVENEAFELVRRNLSRANLFAFGIGSSVNRHLIEGLARAGQGEPFVITDPVQAPAEAARLRRLIESPVLTGLVARVEGLDAYDVEPLALPDVLGERPVILFGKYRGEPRGRILIEGRAADGPFRQVLDVAQAGTREAPALRPLWARHRIQSLSDQEALTGTGELRERITKLGLRYGLLTNYTSFIAIDEVVRVADPAGAAHIDQPQPLPRGVSETALGSSVPTTPEPEWIGAGALVLSTLAMLRRRARRHDARRFTA